ncbi:diguanylate cyclase [Aeromonas enteropelogenes]|uniref:diguanylate cyclase n=1 Tax=Aeromonas enteropelogenes TaxID=29489 RepID=A0ABU9JEU1_AEREN
MTRSPRSLDHLLAYSMIPIWVGAILMLLVLIALTQVPAATRIEEQRVKEHLVRVLKAIQLDIRAVDAFTRDWGIWDDSYYFITHHNRDYIEANLLSDMPMRDFGLNLISYMDLQGNEIWTHTQLPENNDSGTTATELPNFLDDLKRQLRQDSLAQGTVNLHGIRNSLWGPLIFSWQPIRLSDGSGTPNGFLLALRWLDRPYIEQISERTALPIMIAPTRQGEGETGFQPLQAQMTYRLIDLGLQRVRGEGRLLNNAGQPVVTLVLEEERKVLQATLEGALLTFAGMLVVSALCMLLAMHRLKSIVLTPLHQLMTALQRFGDKPDVALIPHIDSSTELATLSSKMREMAGKVSQQHDELLARSNLMEMAAFTDPLTRCFNRRYLEGWLQDHRAEPCTLLLLDLDHFKRINDKFGHDVGDLVLQQLAELLRKLVTTDVGPIVRLGGEEFLLLLQVEDECEIALWVERLRLRVASHRFGREETPLWLTVSLGYCRYPLHPSMVDSFWSHSFKLADMALYRAKQEGRNQWQGYTGTLPPDAITLTPEQIVDGDHLQLNRLEFRVQPCRTSTR